MTAHMLATMIPLLLLLVLGVDATLLASSKLLHCTNSGAETELPCVNKFVVALTVDGGQDATEQIAYWNSATNEDGATVKLQDSIVKISLSKSKPLLRYPVTYKQTYNAQPKEKVIYTGTLACKDDSTDTTPTCGRAYDDDGSPIKHSEGFCCDCGFCELVGVCTEDSRANTNCALLGTASAAHCLTFDDIWYSAYEIGPAETFYTITIKISEQAVNTGDTPPPSSNTSSGAEKNVRTLKLGPENLGSVDFQSGTSARLVGDFAAFKQPLSLEHRRLVIPSSPQGHPRVVAKGIKEWMFLENRLFSTSGKDCNKIGVSYEAFNSQGNKCKMSVGTCLGDQIEDFRSSDLKKIAAGKTGSYMVSEYSSDFHQLSETETTHADTGAKNARPYIAYTVNHVQASVVTLTFVADNMSYSINVATGKILLVNISETFEANSDDGRLSVVVLNTGKVAADFYLSVMGCTTGTFPIQSQTSTIFPRLTAEFHFRIRSEMLIGQANKCNLTLKNSLFHVVDTRWIKWNTTDTVIDTGAQGGTGNGASGGPVRSPPTAPPGSGGSCTDCPWYNPLCFITKQCFWQVIVQIIIIALVILLIVCLIKHHRKCCGKKGDEEEEEAAKKRRRRRREEREREEDEDDAQRRRHTRRDGQSRHAPVHIADDDGGVRIPVPVGPYDLAPTQQQHQQYYPNQPYTHHGVPIPSQSPQAGSLGIPTPPSPQNTYLQPPPVHHHHLQHQGAPPTGNVEHPSMYPQVGYPVQPQDPYLQHRDGGYGTLAPQPAAMPVKERGLKPSKKQHNKKSERRGRSPAHAMTSKPKTTSNSPGKRRHHSKGGKDPYGLTK